MSTKIYRNPTVIFNTRHYGYFSDLIRGIENTKLVHIPVNSILPDSIKLQKTKSKPRTKTTVYSTSPIRVNAFGNDINSPTPPEETMCYNLDEYSRVFTPYVESETSSESIAFTLTRFEAIQGIKTIAIS